MRTVMRFCRNCKKDTPHDRYRENSGGERLFLGVFTLGFSEMMNGLVFECQCCGKKVIKD